MNLHIDDDRFPLVGNPGPHGTAMAQLLLEQHMKQRAATLLAAADYLEEEFAKTAVWQYIPYGNRRRSMAAVVLKWRAMAQEQP